MAKRRTVYSNFLFSIREDRYPGEPPGTPDRSYYVLETVDWVNVIPLNDRGEVVMVEQLRHGVGRSCLEIPGGMVDPEDGCALEAARRELLEETGHGARSWLELGRVHPNPALQSNCCTTFLADGAYPAAPPNPDPDERLQLVKVPLTKIPSLIADGTITHSLVISAFYWLQLRRR